MNLKDHLTPALPAMDQVAQSSIQAGFEHSQGWVHPQYL